MDPKQDFLQLIWSLCLDYSTLLVGFVVLVIIGLDFYTRYVKVNRDTHNVDMMNRYMWLQLHRRYYDKNL